jgi:hypothetical protein
MWPFSIQGMKSELGLKVALEAPRAPKFGVGDYAIINGQNPYKGTLKAGKPYEVIEVYTSEIRLLADNGTFGLFQFGVFDLYKGLGRKMPLDLSREYDDAMRAQDIMDAL